MPEKKKQGFGGVSAIRIFPFTSRYPLPGEQSRYSMPACCCCKSGTRKPVDMMTILIHIVVWISVLIQSARLLGDQWQNVGILWWFIQYVVFYNHVILFQAIQPHPHPCEFKPQLTKYNYMKISHWHRRFRYALQLQCWSFSALQKGSHMMASISSTAHSA